MGGALALRPENKRGIGGYAQVELARGNPEQAIQLLDDAQARWPDDRTLRLLRALTDLACGNAAAVLERLSDAPETLLAAEHAARGQALARLGRLGEAVACYTAAKKISRERNGVIYNPAPFVEKFEAYKAYFTGDRLLPLPRAGLSAPSKKPQPIFLLIAEGKRVAPKYRDIS